MRASLAGFALYLLFTPPAGDLGAGRHRQHQHHIYDLDILNANIPHNEY